jgi:PA-IL-like protein
MTILKGLTVLSAVVLVLAAQVGAAGGVTTSSYTVASTTDEPGFSTGLVLKKGSVTVTATGTVCYIGSLCVGPDGDSSIDTSDPGFLLPGASGIALVGRVGTGPWVQLGSGPTTLSGKGELVLAVNDIYYPDNTGSYVVNVSYKASGVSRTCWPGWGNGDTNHEHCGPPGLANKPPPPNQGSQPTHGTSGEHGNSQENGNSKSK